MSNKNKSMRQRFKEHMERSRKLADDFKKDGINVDMDEKTGEITIDMKSLEERFEKGDIGPC
ncbi:hypothetical protein ACSVC9_10555 [Clostridium sp. LBM24168]